MNHPTFDGSCIRDYVHVEDIAKAHLLALNKLKTEIKKNNILKTSTTSISSVENCSEYNIGLGKGFSVLQIINKVEKIVGKKCPYKVLDRKEGDPAILIACPKKIKKELGWEPRFTAIDDIITHSYEWIKKSKSL